MLTAKRVPNVSMVPVLPRSQWTTHPHFPSQTLLLGSHENFRNVSEYLIGRVGLEDPASLSHLFERWMSAMHSHERYEELKLYPYLERRWEVSMQAAADGHAELHRQTAHVREAFEAAVEDEIRRCLRGHNLCLRKHLDLEESRVIPLLLELNPDEFVAYTNSSLQTLLHDLGA